MWGKEAICFIFEKATQSDECTDFISKKVKKRKKKKTHEKCNYENSLVSSWQNSCVYKELHHFMRNIKYLN